MAGSVFAVWFRALEVLLALAWLARVVYSTGTSWGLVFLIQEKLSFCTAVISCVLVRYTWALIKSYQPPLGGIRGPFLARVTRLWKLWKTYKGSFEQVNIDLHKRHGSVVRIGPNLYSISDPKEGRNILRDNRYQKAKWYQNLFSQRDPATHDEMLRDMQPPFSEKFIQRMETTVDECLVEFCDWLNQAAEEQVVVDLFSEVQHFVFTTVTKTGMSKRVESRNLMKTICDSVSYLALVGVFPAWHRPLFWLKDTATSIWNYGCNPTTAISTFIDREISDRLSVSGSVVYTNDMLSHLLSSHQEDPARCPMAVVHDGCFSLLIPGFDTVAVTTSKIVDELYRKPTVLEKLRREIDDSADPDDRKWTLPAVKLRRMKYLNAVVHEALRIHPAVGLPLERVVPEQGAVICGQYFPAGTVVCMNAWVLNRDKEVFGEDADDFRPERWLKSEARNKRMKAHLLSWGDGSRVYIGKALAMATIQKLVASLIQNFTFKHSNLEQE